MNKQLNLRIAILAILVFATLIGIFMSESAKITNFDECANSGWLLRGITVYDSADYSEHGRLGNECELWTGMIFVKEIEDLSNNLPMEPVPLTTTTKEYVYDDDLGYSFEYPAGWAFYVNIAESVNGCNSELGYDSYTCVDFPDDNIKKVIMFENGDSSIEFTIQSATNIETITNDFKEIAKMSGLDVLSETEISINNVYGYDTLTGTSGWKLRQVVFIDTGTVYIFKYSGQEETYDINEDTFENVINSFNI
ncbi:MAG: hypothetical protein K0B07_01665 [DPANN group archaeon]|nr:hypothetical protein [DPANN group archaeon]